MQFDTFTFIIYFLVVIFAYYCFKTASSQKIWLLLASYIFYAAWNPYFVVLIGFSTVLDWVIVRKILSCKQPNTKRLWLLLSLCSNLGLLSYFKYGSFFLANFQELMRLVGVSYLPPSVDIILPIGISFYTFQTLSYTIDAYRGKLKSPASLLDFSLYVSFFPQLVAGPIVRSSDFLPQCNSRKQLNVDFLGWGWFILISGLFAKVVLSDTLLAPFVDAVYFRPEAAGSIEAWAAVFAFSGQIFFDFGGYSLCAIGSALCLGYLLPENFRSPYSAMGFSDFWRRWHISLSSWLRDYLYIPLGGSHKGEIRTFLSLIITMLLGGLWHGASWQFVIWGGLHGSYLVIERYMKKLVGITRPSSELLMLGQALLTFIVVSLTWVFFRAENMGAVWSIFEALFCYRDSGLLIYNVTNKVLYIIFLTLLLFFFHWRIRNTSYVAVVQKFPWWLKGGVMSLMMIGITFIASGDERAFIYFQF